MKKMTLAIIKGFEVHGRATRMEMLVPWAAFCALIEPHYSKVENGRQPVSLERMLRMYLIANWFNLADEACEDALYGIPAPRDFCRIGLGRERVLDATTLLNFRHLLEEHQIGATLFAKVGELLQSNGMKLSGGTIVDATLIAAPPPTNNQEQARDPEMCQSKTGNQWHFGMKVHIGVDSQTGLIHSASVTPGNVHEELPNLLHGDEIRLYGESTYWGASFSESFSKPSHPMRWTLSISVRIGIVH
jgi:IS5 family transposase